MQQAKEIDTVVMDKTGTITSGRLRVQGCGCYVQDMSLETLVQIAAALEKKSEHPLAEAVVAYAERENLHIPEIKNFKAVFGRGIEGVLAEEIAPCPGAVFRDDGPTAVFVAGKNHDGISSAEFVAEEHRIRSAGAAIVRSKDAGAKAGTRYFVGNRAYMEENGIVIDPVVMQGLDRFSEEGLTPLLVAEEGRLLGSIQVSDEIKSSSYMAIQKFRKMGIHVVMLTGDNRKTAEAVRRQLDIGEVVAEVLPQDKEKKIRDLQEAGRKVAMIGDGINDAPALAAADVGMAIGAGTDVAMESADIVLMKSDLRDAVTALNLSRQVIRNIKQNLFWAFFYNAIGIPLAAGVWYPMFGIRLNPMFGAAAMSLSSIFVVGNALRLKRFKSGFTKFHEERKSKNMTKIMTIEGMMCGHCTGRVQKALEAVEGVKTVTMSLENKTATIELADKVSEAELIAAVTDAGYEVRDMK